MLSKVGPHVVGQVWGASRDWAEAIRSRPRLRAPLRCNVPDGYHCRPLGPRHVQEQGVKGSSSRRSMAKPLVSPRTDPTVAISRAGMARLSGGSAPMLLALSYRPITEDAVVPGRRAAERCLPFARAGLGGARHPAIRARVGYPPGKQTNTSRSRSVARSRDPRTAPWIVGRMSVLAFPGQNDLAALGSAGRLLDGETGR